MVRRRLRAVVVVEPAIEMVLKVFVISVPARGLGPRGVRMGSPPARDTVGPEIDGVIGRAGHRNCGWRRFLLAWVGWKNDRAPYVVQQS